MEHGKRWLSKKHSFQFHQATYGLGQGMGDSMTTFKQFFTKSKIIKIMFYSILFLCLLILVFGFPQKPRIETGGWTFCTRGGFLQIIVWEDFWKYGAMVLRDVETETEYGTKNSSVTWWIRCEWFKR
jgi:hypothetical protein